MIRKIRPSECSNAQIETFFHIVKEGGQIKASDNVLLRNIKNASVLAFFEDEGEIVGVASIKKPGKEYKEDKFSKAGVSQVATKFDFEIGYCVTLESHRKRGINTDLLNTLLDSGLSKRFYATTKSDDMRRLLSRASFRKSGNSFKNDEGEVLDLFIIEL
jgi:hypothetical protein